MSFGYIYMHFCLVYIKGVQDRRPHSEPLWHVNYFELKAIKTLQAHKKLLPLP